MNVDFIVIFKEDVGCGWRKVVVFFKLILIKEVCVIEMLVE